MNWLRSNIKLGSRLALIALALQLVLSFGHFHRIGAPTAVAALAGSAIGPMQPASDRDPDSAVDGCAICAVMAMAGAVLLSAPPILPLPQALEFRYLSAEAAFADPNPTRGAFQPRAPPVS